MEAIRTARAEDLDAIEQVYSAARRYMASHGNPTQWGRTSPPHALLAEDIEARRLYVMEEGGHIWGVFALILGKDPTYAVIEDGSWLHEKPYGTIHRVAGDGSRGGVFRRCVEFCKTICPELRVDTHENNHIMQHVIEQNGFTRRGIIRVADGTPRIAYQLVHG